MRTARKILITRTRTLRVVLLLFWALLVMIVSCSSFVTNWDKVSIGRPNCQFTMALAIANFRRLNPDIQRFNFLILNSPQVFVHQIFAQVTAIFQANASFSFSVGDETFSFIQGDGPLIALYDLQFKLLTAPAL